MRGMLLAFFKPFWVMVLHWLDEKHAVYRLEMARTIPFGLLKERLATLPPVRFLRRVWARVPPLLRPVIAFVGVILLWQMLIPLGVGVTLVFVAAMLIFLLFPFLPWPWRTVTVMSAALPVAREAERQRWLLLRTLPYSTDEILTALHAGATYRVIRLWGYVTMVRLVVLIVPLVFMLVMVVVDSLSALGMLLTGQAVPPRFELFDRFVIALCVLYVLCEPLIDVVFDGALGIFASTWSRGPLRAMLNGVLLRLLLWGLEGLGLLVVLPLARAVYGLQAAEALPVLVLLGPAYSPLLGFESGPVLAMLAVTLLLRVLSVHLVMRASVWRAERIGI